jgi:hypothetical protein
MHWLNQEEKTRSQNVGTISQFHSTPRRKLKKMPGIFLTILPKHDLHQYFHKASEFSTSFQKISYNLLIVQNFCTIRKKGFDSV